MLTHRYGPPDIAKPAFEKQVPNPPLPERAVFRLNPRRLSREGINMIAKAAIVDLLGRTSLFGSLDEAERRAIADEMREVAFEPSQVIFARGDAGPRDLSRRQRPRAPFGADGRGARAVVRSRRAGRHLRRDRRARRRLAQRRRHGREQGQRAQPVEAGLQAPDGDRAARGATPRSASCARASARPTSSSKPSRCIRSKGGSPASSWPPRAPRHRAARKAALRSTCRCRRASWRC